VRFAERLCGDFPDAALVAAVLNAAHAPADSALPNTIAGALRPMLYALLEVGVCVLFADRLGIEIISRPLTPPAINGLRNVAQVTIAEAVQQLATLPQRNESRGFCVASLLAFQTLSASPIGQAVDVNADPRLALLDD